MKMKIFNRQNGQKRTGKTDWIRILSNQSDITIDEENPELVDIKRFKKVSNPK